MPPLITHKRILATASLLSAFWLGSFAQLPSQNYKLKTTAVTVNGKTATAATYSYDDLGRIKTTERGIAGTVSYGYGLHGWTTDIASREFSENLHYADGNGTPCYNGNISSMLWRTSEYQNTRGYKFTYDPLNRLTEAVYGEGNNLSDKQNRYNEKVLEYTANGSMKRFQRRGRKDDGEYGKIDNLNIKLNGNQLLSVTDDALPANKYSSMNFVDGANEETEYEYNGVGALTKDKNRGLTIEYDNLNNPQFMQFNDGNTILYDYSSDGTLLSKTYGAHKAEPLSAQSAIGGENENNSAIGSTLTPTILYSGTTEYSSDIIYKDGKLNKVLSPGGYCTFDHDTQEPQFHYFTQDHLGNNRAVVSESGEVEQITHYYPFGGTFGDAGLNSALQQYKYNGKELDRVAGLNVYDYGARQFYPLVPMWDRMDKMCETYYEMSPYILCGNNPINNVDHNGMYYGDYFNENGKYLGTDGIDDNINYIVLSREDIKKINGFTKGGQPFTRNDISSSIIIPSANVIQRAQEAYDESEKTQFEYGFVCAEDGFVSQLYTDYSTRDIRLGFGYQELENAGLKSAFDVHVHPFKAILQDGSTEYGDYKPSGDPSDSSKDYGYRLMKEKNAAVSEPSWVLGKRQFNEFCIERYVTFYTSKGIVGDISWKKLKNLTLKIK